MSSTAASPAKEVLPPLRIEMKAASGSSTANDANCHELPWFPVLDQRSSQVDPSDDVWKLRYPMLPSALYML